MFKQLKLYGWICVVLAAGILACLAYIACLLLSQPDAAVYADARFVREVLRCVSV